MQTTVPPCTSPWGTGYMVSPSCTRKEQERRTRQEHPAPRRTRGLGDSPHAQQNGTLQSFVCAFGYLVCAVVCQCSRRLSTCLRSLPYHVRAFPTFFVSLQLEHLSSILCLMTSPYAGMQCRCGYDFDEAMFHTAWYMYSQTPFSIFEPFYGGIVNSKQSNLGKVHENAVPCSLVNAMIIRSQRVMQQCRTRPNAQPDPVVFLNAAMLR